jgi:hypothetical protein
MEQPAMACSLTATDLPGRLAEWRALLSSVVERVDIEGGVRLRLGPGVSAAAVAALAARELDCCPFFSFALLLSSRGLVIEVKAPEGAQALVNAFLDGASATPACSCGSP